MSVYDENRRQWPVPPETFFVATRYGKTHVIASGDPASPPVVLLFDVYPKKGGDFSAWLGDLYAELGITRADVIGGSGPYGRRHACRALRVAGVNG